MNPKELLQTIFNASELALLNGRDRDIVRRSGEELFAWIEHQLKPQTPPAPTNSKPNDSSTP